MRVVFLGTPDFAVPSLVALIKNGYDIVGVFTQPDRPAKRGHKLMAPPVKQCAQEHSLNVFQFEKIKSEEGVKALKALNPDIMITAAFGQILSKEVLDIPKYGCINVHGSLLPKYRGAAPIQWAIINGEKITGVTTMYTDIGLDTGDIILKKEIEIKKDETAGELFDRMAPIGADLLIETLKEIEKGNLKREKQNENEATHYPMLKKEMGKMDFNKDANDIYNLVRGVTPWPGAYFMLGEDVIKVLKVNVTDEHTNKEPGTVIKASPKEGLIIACKNGAIEIEFLRAPSGKQMSAKDFLLGRKTSTGTIVG